MGARKQGQMEHSLKREQVKKSKHTLMEGRDIRARMKSVATRATNWLRKQEFI